MSEIITIARVIKKCSKGSYALNKNNQSNSYYLGSTTKKILYAIGALLGVGVAAVFAVVVYNLAPLLVGVQNPSGFISLYLLLVNIILLVCTIPMIMSSFFLSSDIEAFIHMPIKPYQFICAKLYTVVPTCYVITGIAVLPILGGLAAGLGKGIAEYLYVIAVTLTFPVMPVIFISVLSILFMHLCKNVRKKENIVTGITYGISLFTFGFYFCLNMMNNSSDGLDLVAVANSINTTAPWVNWIIPTNMLASQAVVGSSLVSFLIYILAIVAACALFVLVSGRYYIGSALGMGKGSSKASKKKVYTSGSFEVLSQKKALMRNEKNSLFRSTLYVINCFIWPIITPIVIFGGTFFSIFNSNDVLNNFFAGNINGPAVTLFVSLGIVFPSILVAMMSKVTSISISKEGAGFFALRAMPISYRTILKAKAQFGLTVNLIMSLPFVVIIAGICVFAGKMDFMIIPFSVLITFFFVSIINDFQLLFEARNPKLHWESEEMVIKEMRGRIGGLVAIGIFILFVFLGIAGLMVFRIHEYIILGVMTVALAAFAIPFHNKVISYGEKSLSRFE